VHTLIILFVVSIICSLYFIVSRPLKTRYIENHTELGKKSKQIRNVGTEWRELKEHQEMLSKDPIALEFYERKRQDRLIAHKEYDKLVWEAEAPEREARLQERIAQEEKERKERIALYEKETQLRYQENLDTLRQKELNYYNISQSYGGNMLNPTQRLADVSTVLREEPSTNSRSLAPIPSNTIINATGWVHGQNYGGTDIWFAVKMGTYPDGRDYYQYVWSGACTEKHTGGLHDFNEYEEDSYTIRSFDGSLDQTYTNKTLIKKAYPPANNKPRYFYQTSAPKDADSSDGDLWFDSGNQIHERQSGVWVRYQFPALPTRKEIEAYKDIQRAKFYIDAGRPLETITANMITAGTINADKITVGPSLQ
jgi:hypothetical protein